MTSSSIFLTVLIVLKVLTGVWVFLKYVCMFDFFFLNIKKQRTNDIEGMLNSLFKSA